MPRSHHPSYRHRLDRRERSLGSARRVLESFEGPAWGAAVAAHLERVCIAFDDVPAATAPLRPGTIDRLRDGAVAGLRRHARWLRQQSDQAAFHHDPGRRDDIGRLLRVLEATDHHGRATPVEIDLTQLWVDIGGSG